MSISKLKWQLVFNRKVIAEGTQSQIKKAGKSFVDSRDNVFFLQKRIVTTNGTVIRTIPCNYTKRFGRNFKEKHMRELEALCNPSFNL